MLVTDAPLRVGDRIERSLLGSAVWEVVERRPATEGLVGARDRTGRALPAGGTLVCRGVA